VTVLSSEQLKLVYQVSYDIRSGSKYPNPSGIFRRHGARINLSVWVVPQNRLPMLPLADMRSSGVVSVRVSGPFDGNVGDDSLLSQAKDALRTEVARIRKGLETAVPVLRKRLVEAATVKDEKLAKFSAYTAIRRATQDIAALEEASLAFDLTGEFGPLAAALHSERLAVGSLLEAESKRHDEHKALPTVELPLGYGQAVAS
jgi:hypothetical protein